MRMNKIAKGLGLCTIGFVGGVFVTGYQIGKLVLENHHVRKWIKDYCIKTEEEPIFEEWEDTTVLFDTMEEAEEAAGELMKLCAEWGEVTLADIYSVCKVNLSHIYSNWYALGWKEENLALKIEPFKIHRSGCEELCTYYKMIFIEKPRKLC